jgi:hypothetical protein
VKNSNGRPLRADEIAAAGVVEIAYVDYVRFSLEAVHCSATTLGRHLSNERTETTDDLTISVVPKTSARSAFVTVLHACNALTGAAVAANEIVGFTQASPGIAALVREFQDNGWDRLL